MQLFIETYNSHTTFGGFIMNIISKDNTKISNHNYQYVLKYTEFIFCRKFSTKNFIVG